MTAPVLRSRAGSLRPSWARSVAQVAADTAAGALAARTGGGRHVLVEVAVDGRAVARCCGWSESGMLAARGRYAQRRRWERSALVVVSREVGGWQVIDEAGSRSRLEDQDVRLRPSG